MASDRGRGQDGRQSPSFMLPLYIGLFALVILSGFFYLKNLSTFEVGFNDLLKLAEATKYESVGSEKLVEGSTGQIVVETEKRKIRLSKLRDIKVGATEITGFVQSEVEYPRTPGVTPNARAQFRTFRNGVQEADNRLVKALIANNIPWGSAPPPSIWNAYIPLLLISGVFTRAILKMAASFDARAHALYGEKEPSSEEPA